MDNGFRKSMNWLHTWSGVVLGSLLFLVFWMGTLSVFDREIDTWLMPSTRIGKVESTRTVSIDRDIRPILEQQAADKPLWTILLPEPRSPIYQLVWSAGRGSAGDEDEEHGGGIIRKRIHPQTLEFLADPETQGASQFFYTLHHNLTIRFAHIGAWIVGFASMAMLALIVTGVVVHRKIFVDFFTFRSRKSLGRSSLDLHNLTGVLALPFHFVITLSGLVILFAVYFPAGYEALYPGARNAERAMAQEVLGQVRRPKAGTPGTLASLDAMRDEAEQFWGGLPPYLLRVAHPMDANSYVVVRRTTSEDVTKNIDNIHFKGTTGEMLSHFEVKPVASVLNYIEGLHYIRFDNYLLRWLYFIAGLAGCVMIATGFIYWLEARRASHAKSGRSGVRVVEALTVASVLGLLIATLAFLVANRILPLGYSIGGVGRARLEIWAFYGVWILAFVHAVWRGRAAWLEQAWATAAVSILAVLLNWITTGDHLLQSASEGLWGVAGTDLMLLALAAVSGWAALKLQANRSWAVDADRRSAAGSAEALKGVVADVS